MRKTKAQKEEEANLEERRAKDRERWKRRTTGKSKKVLDYKKKKQEKKAEWQAANAKKNLQYVQDFYERWGISGREARALGKEGATSGNKDEQQPPRTSRKRDTGSTKSDHKSDA